jgi:hypothetical protein
MIEGLPETTAQPGETLTLTAYGAGSGGSYCFSESENEWSGCTYTTDNMYTVIVPEGATTVWIRAINTEGCKYSTFITEFSAGAGEIVSSGTTAILGYQPRIYEPTNEQPATAGATYMWRREGTHNAWLANGNEQAYDMDNDLDGVSAPGTYYYRRYAHSRYATGDALVPAKGTYTLVVVAPPPNDAGTYTWLDTVPKRIWTGNLNGTQAQTGCAVYTRAGYPHAYEGGCLPTLPAGGCAAPWLSSNNETYYTAVVRSWIGLEGWTLGWYGYRNGTYTTPDYVWLYCRCQGASSYTVYIYGFSRTGAMVQTHGNANCVNGCRTQRRCVALWNY